MTPDTFARCQALAELALAQQGVTFSVYSDQRGTEKIFPVCLVPRVIAAADWARLERGLVQRLPALQLFLDDIYGEQKIAAPTASSRPSWSWRRASTSRGCAASSRRAACASTSPASI